MRVTHEVTRCFCYGRRFPEGLAQSVIAYAADSAQRHAGEYADNPDPAHDPAQGARVCASYGDGPNSLGDTVQDSEDEENPLRLSGNTAILSTSITGSILHGNLARAPGFIATPCSLCISKQRLAEYVIMSIAGICLPATLTSRVVWFVDRV